MRRLPRSGKSAGNASAGNGDLRSGTEFEITVRVAGFVAGGSNIKHLVLHRLVVIEVVNAVRVIPEYAEVVSCAFHGGETGDHFIRVGDAARV